MILKKRVSHRVLCAILLLVAGTSIAGMAATPGAQASADTTVDAKIISYVREKYGVPEAVKMTLEPFQPTDHPGFLSSAIVTDDGKNQKRTNVFLTRDHHYFILGFLFTLGPEQTQEIIQHVREVFKVPEGTNLTVGPFHQSKFPFLSVTTVIADNGKTKQPQDFYMTKDKRTLVVGNVFDLGLDLRREALRTIVTTNQPSQGPAHAPVTIVEYADLECPNCARLHAFLEKELLPKYGDKVRIIFKEFPLVLIHDWSLTAAIANECVYQIKPDAFAPYRSLIFEHQASTNAATVRDTLLGYADQVGVDPVKLAGCLDSKASMTRIDTDTREAKKLDVQSTPTAYVNGRTVVGFQNAESFYAVVDEALKEAK